MIYNNKVNILFFHLIRINYILDRGFNDFERTIQTDFKKETTALEYFHFSRVLIAGTPKGFKVELYKTLICHNMYAIINLHFLESIELSFYKNFV